MQIHKPSLANRIGKRVAKPLSWVVCSPLFYKPSRMFDAYLNFLIGKGSGTGWDMREEVRAAATGGVRRGGQCGQLVAKIIGGNSRCKSLYV